VDRREVADRLGLLRRRGGATEELDRIRGVDTSRFAGGPGIVEAGEEDVRLGGAARITRGDERVARLGELVAAVAFRPEERFPELEQELRPGGSVLGPELQRPAEEARRGPVRIDAERVLARVP
jgi:hypothetical protein